MLQKLIYAYFKVVYCQPMVLTYNLVKNIHTIYVYIAYDILYIFAKKY